MKTSNTTSATPFMLRGKLPVGAVLFAALACMAGAAQAQATPPAGTVLFVSGPAFLLAADGTRKPLQTGAAIHQGEQVATGADGYAHVRMVDNAFVAVRPDSRLAIELYEYDAAKPAASRIKLQLHTGNARTVSGKGGEAAKHNYRFNTPMAAIGLRGTDYTVTSTDSATRVTVSRGAVAVTPLGDGCSAAALGPCASGSTRELNAGLVHAYMEVSARNRMPVLVRPDQDPQGGSGQNPPNRPDEPRADVSNDLKLTVSKETATQVAADRLAGGLTTGTGTTPTVVPAPAPAQLVWGRWSGHANGPGAPAITTLLDGSREVVVGNSVFGLLRSGPLPAGMPTQGSFNFQMAGSEAYTLANGVLGSAQVVGGMFGVDFNQRSFNTALSVQHAGGVEQLSAQGRVQFQGQLIADAARSTMNMSGAIAGNGAEAAYLFDKQLATGGLLGAVRWVR